MTKTLRALFVWKGATFGLLILVAATSEPYDAGLHRVFHMYLDLPWPRGESIVFESRLATWDSGPYLKIAWNGYTDEPPLAAYYPLLPAVIRCATAFVKNPRLKFWLALIICQGISVAAIYQLFQLFLTHTDPDSALTALILLLALPSAFVLSLIYTEGLFLLLLATLLLSIAKGDHIVACCCSAFLLPLTRPVGVLVIGVILARRPSELRPIHRWSVCLLLAGFALYVSLMWLVRGDPFAGFSAQRYYANQPSIMNVFEFNKLAAALISGSALWHPTEGIIDRVHFCLTIGSLPCLLRRDRGLFALVVLLGVLPALSSFFVSYSRFSLCLFPVYVLLAEQLKQWPRVLLCWIVGSVVLQGAALVRHTSFLWVA